MATHYLVTSALPYANGYLHIGHMAGAYLPADTYHRHLRLRGLESVYVCGSDEHGVPITITAEAEGVPPGQVIDRYHAAHVRAFSRAAMSFDIYHRTSWSGHHALTREFFLRLLECGYIEKGEMRQLLCDRCGRFLPDRYVEGVCPHCNSAGARGDQCDACGRTLDALELERPRCKICGSMPRAATTTHWFLRLPAFSERLREWLTSKADWRASVREFALGWVREGLRERAITRDLDWGVKVPLEGADGKVIYVWFDAPIGYVSFTQEWAARQCRPEAWKAYWQSQDGSIVHFIGKDNTPFHAVTWPAMLMGMGDYQLPAHVVANEYLNFGESKFSKSRGNVVRLDRFCEVFGSDALRFYLTAVAPETQDSVFTFEDFKERVNAELVNIVGNFMYRTVSFAARYFDGRPPDAAPLPAVMAQVAAAREQAAAGIEGFRFRQSLAAIVELARYGNRFFDDAKPWETRKTAPAKAASDIATCLELAAGLAVLLYPVTPEGSLRLIRMLSLGESESPAEPPAELYAQLGRQRLARRRFGALSIPFERISDERLPSLVEAVMRPEDDEEH